jgi:hypothetical protein
VIEIIDKNNMLVLNPDLPQNEKYRYFMNVYVSDKAEKLGKIFPKDGQQWVRITSSKEYNVSGLPRFENPTSQNAYNRK